ncbi:MAG: toll/interleukin-1 receptor domain-containing protein [Coriobacteriia bacterium]|nr:toll/interleukin-1 receptor domain-containing protein [Coriobacteriia bacterium]
MEEIREQTYSYYAFISYSRKDESWAKWLQKALEQYRLPTVLRKEESTLPKKIHPIFRDKTDLTTGQLQTALHQELNASKKLIVLCSPASARSEWVDKEVQRFIDAGRVTDIIPLIVDGIPNSGDETECFMPALRLPEDEQLLGVSIPELGKKDAFLRIVAGLLDIKFDQLKRRHEQRRKRQNLITAAAIVVFLAAASIGGYKAWDYYVPHKSYYTDYVLCWGVPEGIGELTQKEVAVREGHYVITTQKGLIRELAYANSAGTPMEHLEEEFTDLAMISRFFYRDDGRLEYVEYVDNNDKVLATQVYTTDLKAADFQVSAIDSSLKTLAGTTTSTSTGMFDLNISGFEAQRSDISRHLLEYDENGYVTSIIYMRDRRTPILDADGIGGLEYTLDALGRPTEIRYLGLNGVGYAVTKKNVAGKRFFYDDAGNRVRIEYFDPKGNLTRNDNGWMVLEYGFDDKGNNVRKSFLDANGNPDIASYGYSYSLLGYDEKGNYISMELFGVEGERVRHTNGPAIITKEYDAKGRIILQSYFDENYNLTWFEQDYARQEYEYDERGNYAGGAFYGIDALPVLCNNGYASLKMVYDERGNRIYEEYFGTDGEPILCADGYASFVAEYDERDNLTKRSCFDTDGALVISGFGYAVRVYTFDDRGNPVRMDFFGTDERPVLIPEGFASVEYDFDDGGNICEHRYFGIDGKPILNTKGYAVMTSEADENGNPLHVAMFGLSGEPVLSTDGYHIMEGEYDERGNTRNLSFLGINGEPVLLLEGLVVSGFATVRFEVDERDNVVKTSFFGLDGKPVLNSEGYAAMTSEFDAYGNGTAIRYFGLDGEPVACKEGYAAIVLEFDNRGNLLSAAYIDENGIELSRYALMIGSDPSGSAALELGLEPGDIFVTLDEWVWFDYSEEGMFAVLLSFYYAVLGTAEVDVPVVLYRLSTEECLSCIFAADLVFDLDELWISEADYQKIQKAYQALP